MPNFSLLVGRREKGKSIKKKKFGSLFGRSHKNICMVFQNSIDEKLKIVRVIFCEGIKENADNNDEKNKEEK